MEEWKSIRGYEGLYEISSLGRVRSLDRKVKVNYGIEHYKTLKGVVLKCQKDRYGYLYIPLSKNGHKQKLKVHRLVAEAFIPNPNNKPCIDHINTIKDDNRVENLRWVTYEENMNNELTLKNIKGCQVGDKSSCSKSVVQISLDGKIIKRYGSIRETTRETGFDKRYISKCCNGKKEMYKNYIWMFYNDYINLFYKEK